MQRKKLLSETGAVEEKAAGLHTGTGQEVPWRCQKASLRAEEKGPVTDILAVEGLKKRFDGVVPDESNLYPELSGFDNLCFCGALYGMRLRTIRKKWIL